VGIQITTRHDSVTDGMKRYAQEKAEKLKRFFDGLTRIEITLDGGGPEQRAEVVLTVAGGEPIAVHADAPRMNAAIDAMIDKADKRLRRYKDKLREHRGEEPGPVAAPGGGEPLESYQDVIERTDFPER
jgi:putative sigma-54 modulation protein